MFDYLIRDEYTFVQTIRCYPDEKSGSGAGGHFRVYRDAPKHVNWDVYTRRGMP